MGVRRYGAVPNESVLRRVPSTGRGRGGGVVDGEEYAAILEEKGRARWRARWFGVGVKVCTWRLCGGREGAMRPRTRKGWTLTSTRHRPSRSLAASAPTQRHRPTEAPAGRQRRRQRVAGGGSGRLSGGCRWWGSGHGWRLSSPLRTSPRRAVLATARAFRQTRTRSLRPQNLCAPALVGGRL
jgi:hypothetical protein